MSGYMRPDEAASALAGIRQQQEQVIDAVPRNAMIAVPGARAVWPQAGGPMAAQVFVVVHCVRTRRHA
jgi:hypothetical protein